MSAQQPQTSAPQLKTALDLAQAIHACRDCQCFWPPEGGENGRFGPVPTYVAWSQRERGALPDFLPTSVTLQAGAPSPALLKGCRRAPAMLVGINPNLKNFGAGMRPMPEPGDAPTSGKATPVEASIRTVHPTGNDLPSYMAYHRRLKTDAVLMQIAPSDFEETCLDKSAHRRWKVQDTSTPLGTGPQALLALGGARPDAQRIVTVQARGHGSAAAEPDLPPVISWGHQENFVALRRWARLGETVAGFLTLQSLHNKTVQVSYKQDGFYTHLGQLAQRMGGVPGEDLALLDMAACASARWQETAGVNKPEVIGNCVEKRGFALAQLLQSRPSVLFFSGKEAWDMFLAALKAHARSNRVSDYLHGLDCRPFGIDPQGQASPSVMDPLGWLRQQATPGLSLDAQLHLQWPVLTSDGAETTPGAEDIWHCRLVPMAHFSYPDNVRPMVHWPAQQHRDFMRDFAPIAQVLACGDRLMDPTKEPAAGVPRAVFFGVLLSAKYQTAVAANLRTLCEHIVLAAPDAGSTNGMTREDLSNLLSNISSAQWDAADIRMAPFKLDPMGLAARIAQQCLCTEWGWPMDGVTPTSTITKHLGVEKAIHDDKPKGRWPRASQDCQFCPAAGLHCDYADASLAATATEPPEPQAKG